MELQKRRQEETNERKNAVEAYVYSLRGKLADSLAPFATEAEAARINDKLNATEVRSPAMTLRVALRAWSTMVISAQWLQIPAIQVDPLQQLGCSDMLAEGI